MFVGIIDASYGYYILKDVNHNCGAFVNYSTLIQPIYNETTVFYDSIEVLTFPPILIALMFLFIGLALLNRNKSVVIESFI